MSRFARAFVTGASSGIGGAVARLLAADGVEVVLAARRVPELERVRAEIAAAGGRAHVQPLDVSRPAEVAGSVGEWDERLGGLDLVLANAGVSRMDAADGLAWAGMEDVLGVNLVGAGATLVAAASPMVRRGRGTLAAVTSLAGVRGMPGSGAYSASKAGLIALLETLRADLEPRGVEVCEVRPGFVRTAMTAANDFRMPFLLELDDAAARTVRSLERGRRLSAFPWALAAPLTLLRLLPVGAWARLARRLHPRGRAAETR